MRVKVHLPEWRIGERVAGWAAGGVGGGRTEERLNHDGRDQLLTAMNELLDDGERMTRAELAKLPKGVFEAEDIVEEDGVGNGPFVIRVKVNITDEEMIVDYRGSSPQTVGPINCPYTRPVPGARCLAKAVPNPHSPATRDCLHPSATPCPAGTNN